MLSWFETSFVITFSKVAIIYSPNSVVEMSKTEAIEIKTVIKKLNAKLRQNK